MEFLWYRFIFVSVAMIYGLWFLLRNRTSLPFYLFFTWAFITGILTTIYPLELFPQLGINHIGLKLEVHKAMLMTLIPMILVFTVRLHRIYFAIYGIALISAIVTIVTYFTRSPGLAYGIMTNTSMEANLLALVIPLVLLGVEDSPLHWISISIMCLAIGLTTSSVGIAGAAIGLSVFFLKQFRSWKALAFIALITGLITYQYRSFIFNTSFRWEIWNFQMKYWWNTFEHFTGSGFGTFIFFGQLHQKFMAFPPPLPNGLIQTFPTLHSDFLQVIFELGFVGIGLAVWAFVVMVKRAWHRPWLLSAVVVYGFTSLINMPSRYIPTAIVGLLIARFCGEYRHDS